MTRHPTVLLRTAIDPAALLDHTSYRDRQVHRAIVKELMRHGVLVLNKDQDGSLQDSIGRLGPDSQTLWKKTIESLNDVNRVSRDPGLVSVADSLESASPGDIWKKALLDLVIAGEENARPHGVDFSSGVREIGETDVVLAATIDRSPVLQKAKNVGRFPIGTPRSDVAEQFLRPLATYSSAVKIIDPHILESFIRYGTKSEHVEWLLSELADSLPPGASVSLLGKVQNDWPHAYKPDPEESIKEILTRALSKRTTPLTINVRLVKSTQPRNRYLWFSYECSYDVIHNFIGLADKRLNEELRFPRHSNVVSQTTFETAKKLENASTAVISVTYGIA